MTTPGLNILFAGTPVFASAHLAALLASSHRVIGVISQPDKPGKRGSKLLPTPVKALANQHGLPVIQPARLTTDDLAPFQPDVMVVVAYGQILKPPVLSLPRLGCINVHASLLPRWRGAAPIQRAMLAGDVESGVCIMQMDVGLDTGDVYSRSTVPITQTDTTGTLTGKLIEAGCDALVATLDALSRNEAEATPQSPDGVTYAKKIEKEEARVDWNQPAAMIVRKIRAFVPDPIAFTELAGMRIKIFEATADNGAASPGEIIELSKTALVVGCGDGAVSITRLQLPVGKGTVLSAADLVNARRADFAIGRRFT